MKLKDLIISALGGQKIWERNDALKAIIKETNKKTNNMKKTPILLTLLTSAIAVSGQMQIQMRTGYALKTNDCFTSAAAATTVKGFSIGGEMMVLSRQDAPVSFGVRISYQIKSIEAGYGKYFDLYSTDKYDAYKNGFSDNFFVAIHKGIFFIQAEYKQQLQTSVGIKNTF